MYVSERGQREMEAHQHHPDLFEPLNLLMVRQAAAGKKLHLGKNSRKVQGTGRPSSRVLLL